MVAGVDFGDAVFAQTVRDGVARIERLMDAELRGADEVMTDSLLHLFLAGGKRFRPLFTVLAAQIGPNPDAQEVVIAGAVIELIHLATLYHDDVMDEAQVRRGAPSANARWGNNVAILAGDYLLATASRLVSRLGPHAVRIIADTFAQLVTGQMRETRGTRRGGFHRAVPEGGPREDGLADRGGGPVRRDVLRRRRGSGGTAESSRRHRGHRVSDRRRHHRHRQRLRGVGKVPGTDVREGVHTLPMLYALRDTGSEGARLRTLLAGPVHDDTEVAEALTLLRASPGMAKAKDVLAQYAAQARHELDLLPDEPDRRALAALVEYTVSRHG